MNRAIAILAAVSVLWHTTAGCCAHHEHSARVGHSPAIDSPCEHEHGCDSEHPSHPASTPCGEVACAFAIPDAPIAIEIDASAGFFISDCILDEQLGSPLVSSVSIDAGTAPFPLASLARHLALGVLLL